MADPHNTYIRCLFCLTGKEESVVSRIKEADLGYAFHPRKKKPFFKNGKWEDIPVSLLPGYVFVVSETPVPLNALRCIPDVIRPLTYGPDDKEGYLTGQDRALALWLMQENGLVGHLDIVKEGSQIKIIGGLMKGIGGHVVKIDRRKRLAHVELEVVGSIHSVWLGINFLESVDSAKNDGVNK